jgi:L-lactate dehydrogenase complex protein LldG
MKDSTSREKILKKVRNALMHKSSKETAAHVDFESPIYAESSESPELTFAHRFTALTGKFAFCESYEEFASIVHELKAENHLGEIFCNEPAICEILSSKEIKYSSNAEEVSKFKTTITGCEALISRTGSIMVSSAPPSGRRGPVSPDIHMVVAYTSQLVEDIKDGFKVIKEKYGEKQPSLISLVTGPSRTADIEKTLVLGAHGPKEIYLFLFDDELVGR